MNPTRRFTRFILAALLFPLLIQAAWSKPFLWKIEGEKPSYLFGTIHSPDPRVAKIGPETLAALTECDALFTEIAFDQPTLIAVMGLLMDNSGKSLEERIGGETYALLDASLQNISEMITAEALAGMKTWAILMTLSVLEHQLKYPESKAIDELLWHTAKKKGLKAAGLETPAEQTEGLDALSESEQTALLKESLELEAAYRAKGEHPLEAIVRAYLSGDLSAIQAEMDAQLDLDDPVNAKLHESLFLVRNRRMADRIQSAITESPSQSFFFAVGAAHYSGQESLLALLADKGLKIERVEAVAASN